MQLNKAAHSLDEVIFNFVQKCAVNPNTAEQTLYKCRQVNKKLSATVVQTGKGAISLEQNLSIQIIFKSYFQNTACSCSCFIW